MKCHAGRSRGGGENKEKRTQPVYIVEGLNVDLVEIARFGNTLECPEWRLLGCREREDFLSPASTMAAENDGLGKHMAGMHMQGSAHLSVARIVGSQTIRKYN